MKVKKILSEIENLLNHNLPVDDEIGLGVYLTKDALEYHWYLNNEQNQKSDYSVKVDSEEQAFEIISKFSGENIDDVRNGIKKFNTYAIYGRNMTQHGNHHVERTTDSYERGRP